MGSPLLGGVVYPAVPFARGQTGLVPFLFPPTSSFILGFPGLGAATGRLTGGHPLPFFYFSFLRLLFAPTSRGRGWRFFPETQSLYGFLFFSLPNPRPFSFWSRSFTTCRGGLGSPIPHDFKKPYFLPVPFSRPSCPRLAWVDWPKVRSTLAGISSFFLPFFSPVHLADPFRLLVPYPNNFLPLSDRRNPFPFGRPKEA